MGQCDKQNAVSYTHLDVYKRQQLLWLNSQGFSIVEFKKVTQENIEETVNWFEENIRENDLPSDGLVLTYDDIKYGESLGSTAKFPKDSIAFKWSDEIDVYKRQTYT